MVDLRHPDQYAHHYRVGGGEAHRGLSVLEHYQQRPAYLEDVSYFTFLCSHPHRAPYNVRSRAKSRIINYFPQYAREDVGDYGRAKRMLHHPFRTLQDLFFLPAIHDEPCDAYREGYEMCRERCTHPHDGFDDPLPNPEPPIHEDTQEGPDEKVLNNMDAE